MASIRQNSSFEQITQELLVPFSGFFENVPLQAAPSLFARVQSIVQTILSRMISMPQASSPLQCQIEALGAPEQYIEQILGSRNKPLEISGEDLPANLQIDPVFERDVKRCGSEQQSLTIEGKQIDPKAFSEVVKTCYSLVDQNEKLFYRLTQVATQRMCIAATKYVQISTLAEKGICVKIPRETASTIAITRKEEGISISCKVTGDLTHYFPDLTDRTEENPLPKLLSFEANAECILSPNPELVESLKFSATVL